jgi:hypothetical protein
MGNSVIGEHGVSASERAFGLEVLRWFCTQARLGGIDLDAPIVAAGHTVLQVACVISSVDVVQALVDAGSDPEAVGGIGQSPAQLARSSGHADIADFLERWIARDALRAVSGRARQLRATGSRMAAP